MLALTGERWIAGARATGTRLSAALVVLSACAATPTPRGSDGTEITWESVTRPGPPVPLGPPSSPEGRALLQTASTRAQQGDEVGARLALERVRAGHPATLEALEARVLLAEGALARRDFAAAEAIAAEAVAPRDAPASPAAELDARAQLALARALEARDAFTDAAGRFSTALKRGATAPTAPDAARGLVRSAFFAGDPARAEAEVRHHLTGQPDRVSAQPEGPPPTRGLSPGEPIDAETRGTNGTDDPRGEPPLAEPGADHRPVVNPAVDPALAQAEPTEDVQRIRALVAEVVEPELTPARLGRLFAALPVDDPWRGWVALRHAQHLCAVAQPDGCSEAARAALEGATDPGMAEAASALLELTGAWRSVRPRTVGVLLPTSGRFAAIGAAARDGVALALEGFPGVEAVWRDTGGDAEQAAREAERLILEDRVVALLGPVGKLESTAVAAVSRRFGIPHVVLSSAEDVAAIGPTILRLRLSPEEQARAVARFTLAQVEAKRVAILYPKNESGESLMGAYWDEVVRLGGEVWAVASYEPGTTEFSPVLAQLLGTDTPGKGEVAFDALFIPDGAATIRRLLPFLKYWGVTVRTRPGRGRGAVQLVGAAGWNHPAVIDRGDNLSDNAVFADAFHHDPDDPIVDRFAKRYFVRHQQRPASFHAEAYDAATVLAGAVIGVDGSDHRARSEVLERLGGTRNHEGVTGLITVLPGGVVVRQPRLLTIDLDEIRPRLSEEEEEAIRGLRLEGRR